MGNLSLLINSAINDQSKEAVTNDFKQNLFEERCKVWH